MSNGVPVVDRLEGARKTRQELISAFLRTDDLEGALGQHAVRGGAIAIGGQAYRLISQLFFTAILSRLLTPADFGLVAMSMTITAFVGIFSDLGLSSATVQRQKLDQDTVSGLMVVSIGMGVAVMLAGFILAPIGAMLFDDRRVLGITMVSAAAAPVSALSAQQCALLQRRMRFMTLQLLNVGSQTVGLTVAVLLAWLTDAGYWSLVASTWTNTIVFGALAWTFSPWRPSRVRDWSGVRESVNFGAYLTGYSVVEYFHRQSDNLLIGWKFSAASLGQYTRAYGLFFLPTSSLIYPLFEVAKPILSRTLDDPARYRSLFHLMLLPLNILTGIFAGGMFFLAPLAIPILYGDQWGPSVSLFQILSVCISVQAITISLGWILISTGRSKLLFRSQLLLSLAFFVAFFIAVHFSLTAVAMAYVIVSLAFTLPMIWLAVRDSPIAMSNYLMVQGPAPVAALISLGVVLLAPFSQDIGAVSRCAVFCIFYAAVLSAAVLIIPDLRSVTQSLVAAARARFGDMFG